MKTFKEVVKELGNKSYPRVELRCNMMFNGRMADVFVGVFAYDGVAGRIIPIDGDTYNMYMECEQWKEFKNGKETCLSVYVRDGHF